jgi:hypothetical protein
LRAFVRTPCVFLSLLMLSFQVTSQHRQSTSAEIPKFDDYPVDVWSGSPVPVMIHAPEERLYRTNLRNTANRPPNFAGHYSFVDWGCGTNCLGAAVVDQQSGKVFQPPFPVSKDSHADEHWMIDGLFFFDKPYAQVRPDSRLMILTRQFYGKNGYYPEIFYLVWENEQFRTVLHTIAGHQIPPEARPERPKS